MRFRFASFNMMNMSEAALTKRDFSSIAEIIQKEKFDVVAFQEILSQGKSLDYLVKHSLPGWEIRWAEPRESSDPTKTKDKRGEGYAFAWNTRRLQLASSATNTGKRIYEPRIINEALRYDVSFFARIPYYARFVPVNGGFFEFRLVNVHLHFGNNTLSEIEKRQNEYNSLIQDIYPEISTERRYGNNMEAYTIVMGDYNLNLNKPRGEAEKRIDHNTYIKEPCQNIGNQIIETVQDELTTLKTGNAKERTSQGESTRGYAQNYDHFSFDTCIFIKEGIEYKANRIDAVRQYYNDDFDLYRAKISDHIPIVLELLINEKRGTENGEIYLRNRSNESGDI